MMVSYATIICCLYRGRLFQVLHRTSTQFRLRPGSSGFTIALEVASTEAAVKAQVIDGLDGQPKGCVGLKG
jgi:hypothetical protein